MGCGGTRVVGKCCCGAEPNWTKCGCTFSACQGCPDCRPYKWCDGSGFIKREVIRNGHDLSYKAICPGCPDCKPCKRCGGKGWIDTGATVTPCLGCPDCKPCEEGVMDYYSAIMDPASTIARKKRVERGEEG